MRRTYGWLEHVAAAALFSVVAALTVPRFSRAGQDPAFGDARQALSWLRNAIELYYHDHGSYPGQRGDGVHAAETSEAFVAQLTLYTDEQGRVTGARGGAFRFGPYLRRGVPPCPVPPRQGQRGVVVVAAAPEFVATAADAGWVYNCRTGDIAINSDGEDPAGARYDRR